MAPSDAEDEPGPTVVYGLEGALALLAALEDARDVLADGDHLVVLMQLEREVATLSRTLGSTKEGSMAAEMLRVSEAARRLTIPTKEVLRLVHERKIRFVMIRGIAHIPSDAIDEYRAKAS